MKKTTAWLLLTTYLGASCAGLLPLVADMVAHVFWHQAHIQHVHHGKKGQAHVAAEMVHLLSNEQNQPGTFSEISGSKFDLSTHYSPLAISEGHKLTSRSFVAFPSQPFSLPGGVKPRVFLPPKQS
ncbi:MAG: hypothetical protein H7246_17240 [Phycisphaerae bacterium]|nr:hypothetical protein [Saprospiraceae bacterium]